MLINEIFSSLNGEGPDSGLPATFIRLQGCNVACKWCDTKYAWGPADQERSVDSIIEEVVVKSRSKYVTITGGEPLVQVKELGELVAKLQNSNFYIAIETNGTLSKPDWWKRVTWDIDYKCPSAGVKEPFQNDWLYTGGLNRLKFVVADEHDLVFIEGKLPQILSVSYAPVLLVSPAFPAKQEWLQKVWEFCVAYGLRYSLQIHKIVYGDRRGV